MTPKFILMNVLFAFGLWAGLMADPIEIKKGWIAPTLNIKNVCGN